MLSSPELQMARSIQLDKLKRCSAKLQEYIKESREDLVYSTLAELDSNLLVFEKCHLEYLVSGNISVEDYGEKQVLTSASEIVEAGKESVSAFREKQKEDDIKALEVKRKEKFRDEIAAVLKLAMDRTQELNSASKPDPQAVAEDIFYTENRFKEALQLFQELETDAGTSAELQDLRNEKNETEARFREHILKLRTFVNQNRGATAGAARPEPQQWNIDMAGQHTPAVKEIKVHIVKCWPRCCSWRSMARWRRIVTVIAFVLGGLLSLYMSAKYLGLYEYIEYIKYQSRKKD